jgi:hypothetical protein
MGLEVPLPDDQVIRGLYVDELDDKVYVGLVDTAGHRISSLMVTPSRWPRIGAAACQAREGIFTVSGLWCEGEPAVVEIRPSRPGHDQESWLAEGSWQITVHAVSPEGAEMQALAHIQSQRPDSQADPSAVRHLHPARQQPAHAASGR